MSYLDSRATRSSKSQKGGTFVSTNGTMDKYRDKMDSITNDCAKTIAQFAKSENNAGTTDVGGLEQQVSMLIKGFPLEQQNKILTNAIAMMIANM